MLQILGLLGGLFAAFSFIPYARDIFLLRVKPQRTTFFIWLILGLIAFFSQLAKGATNSLWLPGLETFGVFATFILSIKYGIGGFSKKDYTALLIAGLGLVAWYYTKEAAVALYLVIFVDGIGSYLVVNKAYFIPESETHMAWILSAIGGILSTIAVGNFNIVLLSYPLYIAFANIAVVIAIQMGLRRKFRR